MYVNYVASVNVSYVPYLARDDSERATLGRVASSSWCSYKLKKKHTMNLLKI